MRKDETVQFILENFAACEQDFPWEDTPNACVFRHTDNRKWLALIMEIPYRTLTIDRNGKTYFINLKSEPDLIEDLKLQPGFLPAYHMNKTHWITALLDGSAKSELLKNLIAMSYQLTSQKRRQS